MFILTIVNKYNSNQKYIIRFAHHHHHYQSHKSVLVEYSISYLAFQCLIFARPITKCQLSQSLYAHSFQTLLPINPIFPDSINFCIIISTVRNTHDVFVYKYPRSLLYGNSRTASIFLKFRVCTFLINLLQMVLQQVNQRTIMCAQ